MTLGKEPIIRSLLGLSGRGKHLEASTLPSGRQVQRERAGARQLVHFYDLPAVVPPLRDGS